MYEYVPMNEAVVGNMPVVDVDGSCTKSTRRSQMLDIG